MTPVAAEPPAGGGTTVPASQAAELDAVLALQDIDTAVSQLQHRLATLPERAELAALRERMAAVYGRAAQLQSERDELTRQQADLEQQLATAASRRRTVEQRLYAARNTSSRDLQAMDDEIRRLAQRQSELEEAELELMVAADPLEAELAELAAAHAQLDAEASDVGSRLAGSESAVEAELHERQAARVQAAAAVPDALLARYEALRARLGGIGAARLVGNRCTGCHLELPSMEVERIRHLPPGTALTCDQCGRILVPSSSAPHPGPVPAPGEVR